MKIDETYRNRLAMYLNSFDDNIDRDLLEVDLYDEEYEKECLERFEKNAELFYEECKKNDDKTWRFRYPNDRTEVKFNVYYSMNLKKYESLENCQEDIKNELLAYKKYFEPWNRNQPIDKTIHFGKKIGRSNDRYDYFMFLKHGLSYQPKYITKEELIKILKEDKYGYSSHCIF